MSKARLDPKWFDDPELRKAEQARRAHRGLVVQAIIWTPLFVLCFGALLYFGYDVIANDGDGGGTWFLVIVLAFGSLLFGSQGWQALTDLVRGLREAEGIVTRRWSRSDSFVFKSHYVRVEDRILRGEAYVLADIVAGDRVRAQYYPHSGVLVDIERIEAPPSPYDPSQVTIAGPGNEPPAQLPPGDA